MQEPADLDSSLPHESPLQALPIPKASRQTQKKRRSKKASATILTSLPYKNNLTTMSLGQKVRTKKITIQKHGLEKKDLEKTKKMQNNQAEREQTNMEVMLYHSHTACFYFQELYSKSLRKEGWISCMKCCC